MELIDIGTVGAVVLTLPLLAVAIRNLWRYAESRTPPARPGAARREESGGIRLG